MATLSATRKVRVHGEIAPPGDKSISHRALILAAIARGRSRITGLLRSADVESTAAVLRALGAGVPALSGDFVVVGVQSRFLRNPQDSLDCGNSGTTARLMAGVVAGAGLTATFTGDASLSRRPMRRVADPLRAMGAAVELAAHGGLPMNVTGAPLHGIAWESPVASAQVKSCILLAALLAGVRATVREPHLSRDHTERMLGARNVDILSDETGITVEAGQSVLPVDSAIPGDPSSAAFFVSLATLAHAGELRVRDVCLNETRTGFYRVLKRMGADFTVEDRREDGGEPVGTIIARPAALRGVSVSAQEVPSLIDELPLFACVAAMAEGESTVEGAGELRVKESDRITAVVRNLAAVGVSAEERPDGFVVHGSGRALRGRIATHGDHRIAMAFGMLAALGHELVVDDPGCAGVSFPEYWSELSRVTA